MAPARERRGYALPGAGTQDESGWRAAGRAPACSGRGCSPAQEYAEETGNAMEEAVEGR